MSRLTSQLIENFPFSQYANPGSIQRGRDYYKRGNVWNVDLIGENQAVCQIDGDSGEYEVIIGVDKKGELLFDCDCPYADEGNFCKHMVAAALEVSEYLKDEEEDFDDEEVVTPAPMQPQNWQKQLNETLALTPRQSTPHNLSRYVVAIVLERSQMPMYGYGSAYRTNYSYNITPMVIKSNEWHALTNGEYKTKDDIEKFLETSKQWIKVSEPMYQQPNPAACLNVSPEAITLLHSVANMAHMYGNNTNNASMFLPMFTKLGIPVFVGSLYPPKLDRRIYILPEPIEIKIDMQQEAEKLTLYAGYEHNGQFIQIKDKIESITFNPVWIFMGNRLAQLQNASALHIITSFPIQIPRGQVELFREQYFAQIAQHLPIKSDLVQWHDVRADPIPRLYLHDDNKDKTLCADLRFGYGEHELPLGKEEPYSVETIPDSWDLNRIHR